MRSTRHEHGLSLWAAQQRRCVDLFQLCSLVSTDAQADKDLPMVGTWSEHFLVILALEMTLASELYRMLPPKMSNDGIAPRILKQ